MSEITLTLYRGLNGTNPSAFRVDEDGVSVFEFPLTEYKFNLSLRVIYQGEKSATGIGHYGSQESKRKRSKTYCPNMQKPN